MMYLYNMQLSGGGVSLFLISVGYFQIGEFVFILSLVSLNENMNTIMHFILYFIQKIVSIHQYEANHTSVGDLFLKMLYQK